MLKTSSGKLKSEVKEKLKQAIEETAGLDYAKAKGYTVGQWLDTWLESYAKIRVRPSSYCTYQGFIKNHIKPRIGSLPLIELTSMDLQKVYKELLEGRWVDRIESKRRPKGLSPKTIRNMNQMISSAFNLAIEQKLLTSNPTLSCALPQVEKKEMKTLPLDQLNDFFAEAKESGVFELYYIELATGMRRGELLGLKWGDVNLDAGVIHVRRQVLRQDGKVVEAPLKTKNAYRNIFIAQDSTEVLKAKKPEDAKPDDYVFLSPTGGPILPDSVLHMFHRALKRAGLPKVRFHDLRHTFATLALQNGVDVKTLSGMLGYYSAGFTLDTYAHTTTPMQVQAATTVGSLLSGTVR